MRIFVTGASGWIGSAVVPELLLGGHQVVGLARSEESAASLASAGAEVRRGSLDDLDSLRDAAAACDGVIHLAYKHDVAFTGGVQAATDADRRAIEVFGEALAASDRPLVIASGTLGLAQGRPATEHDGHDATAPVHPRQVNAELTLSFASRGVRSSIVRLSPTVHGDGDKGFMAMIVATARSKGVSAYVGSGLNCWNAVHRLDAARLFRLAVESAPAGSTLHAVGDEAVPTRDIAETIGRGLDLPVVSIAPEEAAAHFGFLGALLQIDGRASSALTQKLLHWHPTHPGLIDDLAAGHYFGMVTA